jgi:putative transposase
MLLSHETAVRLTSEQSNIIGHMCYAARKLWNVCNYERRNYKKLGLPEYPDWFYQKSAHKDDLWYKNLSSQTAQEVCKILDKSWKSFYALLKTGGVKNPQPPRFKHDNIPVTYMQNGISHTDGDKTVRLTLSKQLKEYMFTAYGISAKYLYLENVVFQDAGTFKQVKIYPPVDGVSRVIVVREISDVDALSSNGKMLSIDLGLHNFMTCYDSTLGSTFIVGRRYLSVCQRYDKTIARCQSLHAQQQIKAGVKYPKPSKNLLKLYTKKRNSIKDYLHKCTRYITDYCKSNNIHTVVIGDITGIREDNNLGPVTNQKLHGLPYAKLYAMLEYKLALEGISFVKIKESYSSQCSPLSAVVSKKYAVKRNRVNRGLYKDGKHIWNADAVGAYNIARLYAVKHDGYELTTLTGSTEIINVAV